MADRSLILVAPTPYLNKGGNLVPTLGYFVEFPEMSGGGMHCILDSSVTLCEECLHDQASIGLEIGANFGTNYRAPGQLAVEKKVGEYSHCIGCHVSRSSTRRAVKYQNKSGCFLFLQNVRASNQGSLLIKYLNVRRKIGAKKSHQ